VKRALYVATALVILLPLLSCSIIPTKVDKIEAYQEDTGPDAEKELVVKFILTDNQSNIASTSGTVTYIFLYSPQSGRQEKVIFSDEKPFTDKQSDFTACFEKSKFVTKCEICKGTGNVTCNNCSGFGKVSCDACKGTGITDIPCPGCLGTGKVDMQTYKRLIGFTNPTGCPGADYYIRFNWPSGESTIACPICLGRGKKLCSKCGGEGKILCPKCAGSGILKCTNPDCESGIVSYSGKNCSLIIKFQRDDVTSIEGRNNSILIP